VPAAGRLAEPRADAAADAAPGLVRAFGGLDRIKTHHFAPDFRFVVPAQAGTQCRSKPLDPRLRGDDGLIALLGDLHSAVTLTM
jgi:hypothetical protein